MHRFNKSISTLVLICFLLNTALSDLALAQSLNYNNSDKLAVALGTSDIMGLVPKDKTKIKIAMEEQLVAIDRKGLPLNLGNFQTILNKFNSKENTIYQPTDMQFLWREPKPTKAGLLSYECRLKDRYGLRTYYVNFSLQKDGLNKFPINVYTEKEYADTDGLAKGLPRVNAEELEAAEIYKEHEKYDRNVIQWGHKKDLFQAINFESRTKLVEEIFDAANIGMSKTDKMALMEKPLYIAHILPADEIVRRINTNKVTVIDIYKRRVRVPAYEHASNGATHILGPHGGKIEEYITRGFVHAIGEACKCPILGFDSDGSPINEVDVRWWLGRKQKIPDAWLASPAISQIIEEYKKGSKKEFALANLDKVAGRDYAGGWEDEQRIKNQQIRGQNMMDMELPMFKDQIQNETRENALLFIARNSPRNSVKRQLAEERLSDLRESRRHSGKRSEFDGGESPAEIAKKAKLPLDELIKYTMGPGNTYVRAENIGKALIAKDSEKFDKYFDTLAESVNNPERLRQLQARIRHDYEANIDVKSRGIKFVVNRDLLEKLVEKKALAGEIDNTGFAITWGRESQLRELNARIANGEYFFPDCFNSNNVIYKTQYKYTTPSVVMLGRYSGVFLIKKNGVFYPVFYARIKSHNLRSFSFPSTVFLSSPAHILKVRSALPACFFR